MKKLMVTVCMVMCAGIFLLPLKAAAFNQEQLNQLKATHNCRACDLSGADLSGGNFSAADLGGSDLSGANLSGAKLSGANLSGANLSRANLSAADIAGANLSGAQLFMAIWPDGGKCESESIGKCIK
jgi:uncharacterized protein YjbI with pentapeptide repeats